MLYDAISRGDVQTVMATFPDDVSFHIGGASPVAGDYAGKSKVAGYLGTLMERSGGTFRLEVPDVLANEERATVLTRETAHRHGRALDNRTVHLWEMPDGACHRFRGYIEQTREDFWS